MPIYRYDVANLLLEAPYNTQPSSYLHHVQAYDQHAGSENGSDITLVIRTDEEPLVRELEVNDTLANLVGDLKPCDRRKVYMRYAGITSNSNVRASLVIARSYVKSCREARLSLTAERFLFWDGSRKVHYHEDCNGSSGADGSVSHGTYEGATTAQGVLKVTHHGTVGGRRRRCTESAADKVATE